MPASHAFMRRFITQGRLAYNMPPLSSKKPYTKRSLVATLPRDDLDRLYQWFIERRHGQALRLNRPIFGTHVTIVRHNENVPDMTAWGRYEGREVAIAYDVVLRNHYGFWSLPVYNEWFQEVRAELGLPPEPDFHITVGRQFDWQPIAHGARRDASDIRLERERRERTLSSYRLPGSSSELPTPSPVTIDSDVL